MSDGVFKNSRSARCTMHVDDIEYHSPPHLEGLGDIAAGIGEERAFGDVNFISSSFSFPSVHLRGPIITMRNFFLRQLVLASTQHNTLESNQYSAI